MFFIAFSVVYSVSPLAFSPALSPALSPGSDGLGAVSSPSGETVMIGTAITHDIMHTCMSSDGGVITGGADRINSNLFAFITCFITTCCYR